MFEMIWFVAGLLVGSLGTVIALALVTAGSDRRDEQTGVRPRANVGEGRQP